MGWAYSPGGWYPDTRWEVSPGPYSNGPPHKDGGAPRRRPWLWYQEQEQQQQRAQQQQQQPTQPPPEEAPSTTNLEPNSPLSNGQILQPLITGPGAAMDPNVVLHVDTAGTVQRRSWPSDQRLFQQMSDGSITQIVRTDTNAAYDNANRTHDLFRTRHINLLSPEARQQAKAFATAYADDISIPMEIEGDPDQQQPQ